MSKPLFIAEVKPKSPFGFKAKLSKYALLELAIDAGDMVAIHTEDPWGGSLDWLRVCAAAAHSRDKLVLAKGIHRNDDSIKRALHYGADLVLVVGRKPHPALQPVCLWEPDDFEHLIVGADPADRIVWNSRDLRTGRAKPNPFPEARDVHQGWLCQASLIRTPDNVSPDADAFIVGQNLPEFCAEAIA